MNLEFFTTSEQAWDAELPAIAAAQKTIDLESYIFLDDTIGRQFLEALAERAGAGVQVRCIFDNIGSFGFSDTSLEWCKTHGIQVELFHRFFNNKRKIPFWTRALERTHRKALIIDNKIAFVGGVNIQEDHRHQRDLQIRLTDQTAIIPLQETFNRTWDYLRGNYLKRVRVRLGERLEYFGQRLKVEVWTHEPRQENQSFQKLFKQLLRDAKHDVLLVTPYFFPSAFMLKHLKRALKRGVQIRLLAPWTMDVRWTVPLMREYLRAAEQLGIQVRDAGDPLIHAKVFLIDGVWGVVGSANVYTRSALFDRELSVIIRDQHAVKELKNIVEQWWEQGSPLTKKNYQTSIGEWLYGLPARILRNFI